MSTGPEIEVPIISNEVKSFEIFIGNTLNVLLLSCVTAYITLRKVKNKL